MWMKWRGNGTIWELSHVELRVIDVGNEKKLYLFQRTTNEQLSQNIIKTSLHNFPHLKIVNNPALEKFSSILLSSKVYAQEFKEESWLKIKRSWLDLKIIIN